MINKLSEMLLSKITNKTKWLNHIIIILELLFFAMQALLSN